MRQTNDPGVVRDEYTDESRFAVRAAAWRNARGPSPLDTVFDAVAEVAPKRVIEVGCGRGEMAARIQDELRAEVVAIDQSERMVSLSREPGIDARLGDVQSLPFESDAATNGRENFPELWGQFGEHAARQHAFSSEDGEDKLRQHFARVERREANGTITLPDWEAANAYIAASVTRPDLAGKLPPFGGPLVCTRLATIFIAET